MVDKNYQNLQGNMNNKELHAFITPTSSIQLEWVETKAKLTKNAQIFQEEIHGRYTSKEDTWLLFLGFFNQKLQQTPSLNYLRTIAKLFVKKLSQTPEISELREQTQVLISEEELYSILNDIPMMIGAEYINQEWLTNIWKSLNQSFADAIKSFDGSVADFIKSYNSDLHLVGRIFFHLVENKQGDDPFAFLATYSTQLNSQGKSRHLPLKYALEEFNGYQNELLELLSTVHAAAEKSTFISDLIESGELFHPLALSAKDAFTFLKEIPLYEESGILCRIPNWWKGKTSGVDLSISIGDNKPKFLSMNALLSFNARLMIGDIELTEEEAKKLLEESEGLAFIKNKWIPVDHEKLKQTLAAYENAKKLMLNENLNIRDALRMQLNPEKILGVQVKDNGLSISNGQWLTSVIEKLRNPSLTAKVKTNASFKGKLRVYQQKGLNWLYFLHSLRFGACLADDMGLGKTIQLLAFLNVIKTEKLKNASLLIIPASLISNWMNEINRFFPNLKYVIAHPEVHKNKTVTKKKEKELDNLDLVITTYALSQKYDWIKAYTWNYIILDEAQAIKNPATKQSKSIKQLNCKNRIIMTGTPIENRLADLWSLFDFLNPGLLGNKTEFTQFAKTLRKDASGYKHLRKVINPYILRRMKTDKSIISDLPDKVEVKTFATLSKKQIVLYKNIVQEIEKVLAISEGIQRRGIILAFLMKIKQLCNHPDQYLGSHDFNEKNSGKFMQLREICETIFEKREKVLVFTQFKELTEPLQAFLTTIFGREGLVLHGSIPVGKRKKIIERFQSEAYVPFMVLSLKAGGVGLNLTQANHVVHFDRWWNPAVENQATDRVFRIGQQKNVIVHKFITKGTLEEKIDQMLEKKQQLSENVIAESNETWITEMNNSELMNLFNLSIEV